VSGYYISFTLTTKTHLGPTSRLPLLTVQALEWPVHHLTRSDSDQVRWDSTWLIVGILSLLAGLRGFFGRRGDSESTHEDGEDGFDLGRVGGFDSGGVLAWEEGAGVDLLVQPT
jgi:hypothetical protein